MFRRYIKTFFFPDFIGSFPCTILLLNGIVDTKYWPLEWLCIIRTVRFVTLLKYFHQVSKRFKMGYILRKSVVLISGMILYLQWIACAIHLSSIIAEDIEIMKDENMIPGRTSWAKRNRIVLMSRGEVWRESMLRAVMYTFGANDLFVFSQIQDLRMNLISFFLGIIVTIICTVQTVVIVRSSKAGGVLYENLQSQLRVYLNYKRVPRALRQRIFQYFRFRFQETFYNEAVIMRFLPGHLKQELLLFKSRRLLETVELLKELPPAQAIRLASSVNEEVALANEVLVSVGAPETEMHFIVTGTVAVFNASGIEICHLKDGNHFGEAALVLEEATAEVSVVAVEETRLWTLTRADLLEALAGDEDLLRHMEEEARRRLDASSRARDATNASASTEARGSRKKSVLYADQSELSQHLAPRHSTGKELPQASTEESNTDIDGLSVDSSLPEESSVESSTDSRSAESRGKTS